MTPRTGIKQIITFDEFPQMNVPKFPDVIHDGKVLDSDKNFRTHALIRLVPADGNTVSDLIQFR